MSARNVLESTGDKPIYIYAPVRLVLSRISCAIVDAAPDHISLSAESKPAQPEEEEPMPSLLEEKDAIRDLMYRYCFATDRDADPDVWAGLFTADGIWDGAEFGRFQGHEALRGFMVQATSGGKAGFRHNMSNIMIDVDGETAQARSYFLLVQVGEGGPKPFYAGYYEDKFVKQDGRWLFRERITCAE
jgi:hypothetical protein